MTALAFAASQSTGAIGGQLSIQSAQGAAMQVLDMPGLSGAAKPMAVGTGTVVVKVVDADGSTPVSGAIVTLTLPGFAPVRVLADAQGRAAYRALPVGSFGLLSTRPGYVDGAYGRLRPGGAAQSVELTETVRTASVTVMMWRHAAVGGTVLDEHNEPMVGLSVKALRRDWVAGRRRLTESGADTTDDRGQFRIGALEPGEYVVVVPISQQPSLDSLLGNARDMMGSGGGGGGNAVFAMRIESTVSTAAGSPMTITTSGDGTVPSAGTAEDGSPLTYQTEFYTSATSASRAVGIPLLAGEERVSVDFHLKPVRALSLGGTVIGPEGPLANVQVQLIPADAEDLVSPIETATASTDGNGQFAFTGVPAGQYTLRAQRTARFGGPAQTMTFTSGAGEGVMQITEKRMIEGRAAAAMPTEPNLWAETSVTIGTRALADLTVPMREGLTVSGQLVFQGAAEQPTADARSNIGISLEPADGRTAGFAAVARGRVDATGSFSTVGVPPGKYILRVTGAPQGWTLRSATFGGRDIADAALELRSENAGGVTLSFTDKPSALNGTVRGASGNADPTASVLVFPTDPGAWIDTGSQPRRLRQVRTGNDGRFTLNALPPGEYHVVAIAGSAPRGWESPTYLEEAARSATQVRIGEADTRTITLTSTKGPA